MTCAPSEDSDQPWHSHSLISVFAVTHLRPHLQSANISYSTQRKDYSLRYGISAKFPGVCVWGGGGGGEGYDHLTGSLLTLLLREREERVSTIERS